MSNAGDLVCLSDTQRFVYVVEPMGKVRMSQRDKWAKRPVVVRYRAYHDTLRTMGVTLEPGDEVHFRIQTPMSWSAKKSREHDGTPHQQKPDLDNLLGGLLDGVLEEDKTFWSFGPTSKRWTLVLSHIIVICGSLSRRQATDKLLGRS